MEPISLENVTHNLSVRIPFLAYVHPGTIAIWSR
jgi:hypothetical protein